MVGSGGASGLSGLFNNKPGSFGVSQPVDSFWLSGSCPSFLDSRSMLSFEDAWRVNGSTRPFFCAFDNQEFGEEELDEYFHQREKKRRLTIDQVHFLEKSFEVENRLEPKRKILLAKDLGLEPRQVAIWFQNRRARWKTKQIEKDYDTLQSSYNSLKADCDSLFQENEKLKAEINLLMDKIIRKDNKKTSAKSSDKHDPEQQPVLKPIVKSILEEGVSKSSKAACKQDKIGSAKSGVLDSDSPHYADGVHSSFIETGDSTYMLEPDQYELSQDEEENLNESVLPQCTFPKLVDAEYSFPPPCFEDQTFWSWSY